VLCPPVECPFDRIDVCEEVNKRYDILVWVNSGRVKGLACVWLEQNVRAISECLSIRMDTKRNDMNTATRMDVLSILCTRVWFVHRVGEKPNIGLDSTSLCIADYTGVLCECHTKADVPGVYDCET
jgi:hypothetical protein